MGNATTGAPAHPLAYIRRTRGWSYQDLARVIAEHARALGVPMAARREKVWRWEHWGVVPEPDSQRALARALGVPLCEVHARPWPAWLPAHDGAPVGLPWDAEGSLSSLTALLTDGAEDARSFPIVAGQALRDAMADWAAAASARAAVVGSARDGVLDQDTVSWLEHGVVGLRRLDDRLGGAAVRHRVEADLRLTTDLLRRGCYPPGTGARLFRVAADLAQLGGWACADLGRHAAAQRHYLTGLRLAHSAEDEPLAAGVLAGLSLQAVLADRPEDALAAADAARGAAAGTGTPRVRAMIASRRARAHALLGDADACRRALGDAELLLDAAPGHEDPPWIYYFDAAELACQAGTCLLDLGLAEQAWPLLERGLAAQDEGYRRDRGLYSARAATAHVLAGDLARGCALARDAARLSRQCGSPRLTAALGEFRARLDVRTADAAGQDFDTVQDFDTAQGFDGVEEFNAGAGAQTA